MYGTLAFRSVPARLEIADAQAAADVALTLGLVKPASADLTAYKKRAEEALRETGELLPGVALTEARESLSVKVPGGGDTRESEAAEEAPGAWYSWARTPRMVAARLQVERRSGGPSRARRRRSAR